MWLLAIQTDGSVIVLDVFKSYDLAVSFLVDQGYLDNANQLVKIGDEYSYINWNWSSLDFNHLPHLIETHIRLCERKLVESNTWS